ncbi:glycosyltransferase [Candidatus Woesearchaeota archaeon]|nr:glycosyltransferase [Candidatus Woesearchaeota archaeon]
MALKIIYFGTWEKNYSRNKIIIDGLKKAGADIKLYHVKTVWNTKLHKTNLSKAKIVIDFFKAYFLMIRNFFKIKDYDFLIVGYPGWFDMPLAWFLNKIKGKKLVFDSYFSIYDSIVNDRKSAKKGSLKAKLLFFVDKTACRMADIILLDTKEHIKYFSNEFKIKKNKFIRVFIGADDKIFFPRKNMKKSKKFKVIFHGKFIPLQGVPFIIKAAKLLEDENIEFDIIGGGQLEKDMKKLNRKLDVNNVSFLGFIDINKLPDYLAKADIGLGIFGDTKKAKRVIPNKAFEILAMKIPLLTGDSAAAVEVLEDKKHCVLCKMADPKAIADSILLLKKDKNLRKKISLNGYTLFKDKFSPDAIGEELKKELLKRR